MPDRGWGLKIERSQEAVDSCPKFESPVSELGHRSTSNPLQVISAPRTASQIGRCRRRSARSPDWGHTVVRKEVLIGLAEHDGYKPLFFYPYKRGENPVKP
jgi:hypothetical protein